VTAPRKTTQPESAAQSEREVGQPSDTEAPVVRQEIDRSEAERTGSDRVEVEPSRGQLFAGSDAEQFRGRWSQIQISFVDEPRSAVQQADALVSEIMQRLTKTFADERSSLERQWDTGENVDTEALRQALRRYRTFFDRLLAM
jgi:hypothetical protein